MFLMTCQAQEPHASWKAFTCETVLAENKRERGRGRETDREGGREREGGKERGRWRQREREGGRSV